MLTVMKSLAVTISLALAVPMWAQAPQSPAVRALDLNGVGVISAEELEKASESLRALDKNGDGKLTADEYRPGGRPNAAPASASASPQPTPQGGVTTLPNAPNILLLIADDLGWGDVGFHQGAAATPHLDRLAKDGVELQRFYAYPVCSPTRAALLSGQMPRRFGVTAVMGPEQTLPANLVTLPGTFRAAGYTTSLIGKWHLGTGGGSLPQQHGFEHFYGFVGPEIDYFKHTNQRGAVDWQRDGTTLKEDGYSTFLIADEAIRQLRECDAKRPFFIEVTFNAPHVPQNAPEEFLAKYKTLGARTTSAAIIDAMDFSIGKILAALDEQRLRDNTLVIFFSDNGASRRTGSNGPLRAGKDTLFEGGIRTPCVVRWPGKIAAGTVSQLPFATQDFFPTLAAAAGVKCDAKLDGVNLWPALHEGKTTERPPFAVATGDIAFFDGEWKLIETADGQRALYHITADLSETTDELAKHPEIAERLTTELTALKSDLPIANARRGPGGPPGRARAETRPPQPAMNAPSAPR